MAKDRERIFLSPPHMGGQELEYVRKAFESNFIAPLGPMVDGLEKRLAEVTGFPHVLALNAGTAAMHLALHRLGIGPGDRVLASSLTFIGSVSSVTHRGAECHFVDAEAASWCMDPDALEEAIIACRKGGQEPAAVIPTDLYGQSCDLERIGGICRREGIPLICDSAESLGAGWGEGHAGSGADHAILSFNGNKIITSSGGGALLSRDHAFIEFCRFLSTQARDAAPHYQHTHVGYNFRMSNIVAAVGMGQLEVLEERVRQRRAIYDGYRERLGDLPGFGFMPRDVYGRSNCWLTVVTIDEEAFGASPETVRLALEELNIESRPVWKPMHMQPVYAGAPMTGGAVGEDLFRRGLCLPSGTALGEDDLDQICECIRRTGR